MKVRQSLGSSMLTPLSPDNGWRSLVAAMAVSETTVPLWHHRFSCGTKFDGATLTPSFFAVAEFNGAIFA